MNETTGYQVGDVRKVGFYKRCDALKKRVEILKEHLDSLHEPPYPVRAKKLKELRTTKATYLLNSIELMRNSKAERLMPVIVEGCRSLSD